MELVTGSSSCPFPPPPSLSLSSLCNNLGHKCISFLLNANEVFLHGRLPSTLPDIESEIVYYVSKKNKVSGSKLSNLQFMFIVSSVP